MLFQTTPPTPDTSNYMILGYAVIFSFMAIYLISLVIRNRNLKQDIELLEELDQESQQEKPKEPVKG